MFPANDGVSDIGYDGDASNGPLDTNDLGDAPTAVVAPAGVARDRV